MCGRYASASGRPELLETFAAADDTDAPTVDEPDYNVAPTKDVPAVVTRPRDDGPVRLLRTMRWGLIPSWAKDPSIGSRLINARIESVATKPAFRAAAARRRCLLPADGYYEWTPGTPEPGSRKAVKQPWFITPADGGLLAMAGLWEVWHDADDRPVLTCTVITGDAVDELGHLHDRTPMLVDPGDWQEWLDPGQTDAEAAVRLAGPPKPGYLTATPVSRAVNSVRNNGPQLLEPAADVPLEQLW